MDWQKLPLAPSYTATRRYSPWSRPVNIAERPTPRLNGLSTLLGLVSAVLLALLLFGCASSPTPTPTPPSTKPAEKPTAAAKPKAEATAPTAKPQATAPAAKAQATPAAVADAPLNPPVTLKVGLLGNTLSDAGIAVGNAKGYFKEQGITVDPIVFNSLAQMVPVIATGEISVGSGGIAAGLYNSVARDVSMKVVADKGSTPKGFGYIGLMVRKELLDSGQIKTPTDLKGRNVALPSVGGDGEWFTAEVLKQAGLAFKDVNIVTLAGFSDAPAALANKSVDAAFLLEPLVTRAVDQNIAVYWKPGDQIAPNHQAAVLVYSQKFSTTEAAKRFMVAYLKGVRDYNDAFRKNIDKNSILSILSAYTKLPVDIVTKANPPGLNPDGYVNIASIKEEQDYFFSTGQVKEKADIDKIVDHQYADYAIQKLGKYKYD